MNWKSLALAICLAALACSRGNSLPPLSAEAQQRLDRLNSLRTQAHQLKEEVVKKPNDRNLYRKLMAVGMEQYEFIYTRSEYPEAVRRDILDLKMVMEDMYTLQKTIADIGGASGLDGASLVKRLQGKKVPYAHKRSVPLVDPWGTPYRFFVFSNGQYKIVSAGRAKKFDPADLGITEAELTGIQHQRTNASLDDDIVFIDGRNFTRIPSYPKNAQAFLGTLCEPADELHPERMECW